MTQDMCITKCAFEAFKAYTRPSVDAISACGSGCSSQLLLQHHTHHAYCHAPHSDDNGPSLWNCKPAHNEMLSFGIVVMVMVLLHSSGTVTKTREMVCKSLPNSWVWNMQYFPVPCLSSWEARRMSVAYNCIVAVLSTCAGVYLDGQTNRTFSLGSKQDSETPVKLQLPTVWHLPLWQFSFPFLYWDSNCYVGGFLIPSRLKRMRQNYYENIELLSNYPGKLR